MDRIKMWYRGLSDRWRATLRTAWQSAIGVGLTFLLGLLTVATNLVDGGTLEEAISDTSNLARLMALGFISILSSLVAFAMNRPSADGAASYTSKPD